MAVVQVAMIAWMPCTILRTAIFAPSAAAEGLTVLLSGMPVRLAHSPAGRARQLQLGQSVPVLPTGWHAEQPHGNYKVT